MASKRSMTIIPQDIITTHILCHLPSKSVGQFRCVSKEWLSLLTDPQFIQNHQKTLNTDRFIFRLNDGFFYSVPYNNHEPVSTLTKIDLGFYHIVGILGSVNGLVLATAKKNLNFKAYALLVLNPTTKDYVELPISRQKQFCRMRGFGYDSVSDDYKVVIISCYDKFYWHVNVYNLATNTWSWKQVSHSGYDAYKRWDSSGVFVKGFLHWICNLHSKPVIVALSLVDEKLSELPPPNLYNELDVMFACDTCKLVALGETLGIFNDVNGDIWLMNEYGVQKSWTKIVVHGYNEIPMVKKVFSDNGKVLLLTRDLLRIYDVEKRTFIKSVDVSDKNISLFVSAYTESLVSPEFRKSK